MLDFLKEVFSLGRGGGGGGQFDPHSPFIFQEELNQYQYNLIQLSNNLFRVR